MMDNPYPICENCIFVDEPLDKDPCQECNRAFLAQRIKPNFVSKRKPKTNYDRIISKTPEELADWLNAVLTSNVAPYATIRGANKRGKLLDWLKQEVTE